MTTKMLYILLLLPYFNTVNINHNNTYLNIECSSAKHSLTRTTKECDLEGDYLDTCALFRFEDLLQCGYDRVYSYGCQLHQKSNFKVVTSNRYPGLIADTLFVMILDNQENLSEYIMLSIGKNENLKITRLFEKDNGLVLYGTISHSTSRYQKISIILTKDVSVLTFCDF